MHLFLIEKTVKTFVYFSVLIFCLLATTSCGIKTIPQYHTDIINKHMNDKAKPIWQFPKQAFVKSADTSSSLSGLVRKQPVPRIFEGVEPPLMVGMHLLHDGSIVILSPLESEFETVRIGPHKVYREITTKIKFTRLNGADGAEKWSEIISASGIYNIIEANKVLLLTAREYDQKGVLSSSNIIVLAEDSGRVLWTRSFKDPFRFLNISGEHNMVIYATESKKDSVESIELTSGKALWHVYGKNPDKVSSLRPLLFQESVILFEEGIARHALSDGNILWARKDLNPKPIQPMQYKGSIFLLADKGLTALDVSSGKTLWANSSLNDMVIYLDLTETSLVIRERHKTLFSESSVISLVDPATGQILWHYKSSNPLMGNFIESDQNLFFTSASHVIALDIKNGNEIFKKKLPWDDEYARHILLSQGDLIIVKSEWNIAAWRKSDGEHMYHRHFEPVSPIVTTKERALEQKVITKQDRINTISQIDAYSQQINNLEAKAYYYRNDPFYHGFYLGQASAIQSVQAASHSVQFGASLISMGLDFKKIAMVQAHPMIYPVVDQVISRLVSFDNREYAVRLIGIEDGKQRFIGTEILHLPTGKTTRIYLSPCQSPETYLTMGTSRMSATIFNGYVQEAVYLHHNFSMAIDLQRKRIFHYGPGLNTKDYVYYGDKGFCRGVLKMLSFEPPR